MYWTGINGKQIEYCDLTHDHFMNIIADGYRNPFLLIEALERGINIPDRAVDSMTDEELDVVSDKMIKKALEGTDFTKREFADVLHIAKTNLGLLKGSDYQTYLLYLSRFNDNRDESLRA